MKLSPEKQKNLILTAVVTATVIGGLWFLGIQGLKKKQVNDNKKLAKLQVDVKARSDAIQKEIDSRAQASAYQAFLVSFEEKMPRGNPPDTWLVKELGALAKRHHLELLNTALQPIKELSDFKFKDQPYQLVGFHFEFKGELSQIGKFLETIENSMPMVEVDEIHIISGSEVAPHIHTVDMRIAIITKS